MKNVYLLLLSLVVITFSCDDSNDTMMSDDELIDAIINSNDRVEINQNDLPQTALSSIKIDMPNDLINYAEIAPELGYEIEMKSFSSFVFELDFERNDNQYFAIDGRKLEASNKDSKWGDKRSKDAKGKKKRGPCFKFVYPISYTMADGSIISGNDRKEIHEKMRVFYDSYEKTKDSKEPQLNFPITIQVLDDDKNVVEKILNSYDELKDAMSYCSRGKSKSGDGKDGDGKDGDGKDGDGKRG